MLKLCSIRRSTASVGFVALLGMAPTWAQTTGTASVQLSTEAVSGGIRSFEFAQPWALWLGLLAIAVAGAGFYAARQRAVFLARYAEPTLLQMMGTRPSPESPTGRGLLLLAGALLTTFAAARPQWGYSERTLRGRGLDVLVAVDVSRSMEAQDYKPSRLVRARNLLQSVLWEVRGDRVGVMAFAGDAAILCPLTLDMRMAKAALDVVGPQSVSVQGTDLGHAVDTAIKAFDSGSAGDRILILLTDGEDQGGDFAAAAQRAAQAGVKIYGIGIGTTQGGPIPGDRGYKQDGQGKLVNTKLDFDALMKAAAATGGRAVKANTAGAAEVRVVLDDLASLHGKRGQDQLVRVPTDRYPWFLAPAIVLLLAEAFLSAGWTPPRSWTLKFAKEARP